MSVVFVPNVQESNSSQDNNIKRYNVLILFFFYRDELGSLACSHSELILKLSHRHLVGLSWTGEQPMARPLPAQDNTNTE
jgi:hypothetical protein